MNDEEVNKTMKSELVVSEAEAADLMNAIENTREEETKLSTFTSFSNRTRNASLQKSRITAGM